MSVIDVMPYAHVSSLYTRTLLQAYEMTLAIIDCVINSNGTKEIVLEFIRQEVEQETKIGDMFMQRLNDGQMADYCFFLALTLEWFEIGETSCDSSYIRYHYSIGV